MPEVIDDLSRLPRGSHAIAFYTSREEAAEQAVDLLAGSPEGQAASFWVADPSLVPVNTEKLAVRAPAQVGCVHVLEHEQVSPKDGRLRPVEEVLNFVGGHPDGVTGGADTITQYWAPWNVPKHIEYEAWFQAQPRGRSRFLCPYDLRRVPPDQAPTILRELARHHSHVVLSSSEETAVRLLQLFVFGIHEPVPPELAETADWAEAEGLITVEGATRSISLTAEGDRVIAEWANRPVIGR